MESESIFLNLAIEEAQKSAWPFGAVVVKDGEVIAKAGAGDGNDNLIDPTAHAETNAIRRACQKLKTGNLEGCVLYASCEPCALCFGAAWYAGIKEIVYGASLKETEAVSKRWGGDLGFPHDHIAETGINMKGGVLKDEVIKMYESHPKVKVN